MSCTARREAQSTVSWSTPRSNRYDESLESASDAPCGGSRRDRTARSPAARRRSTRRFAVLAAHDARDRDRPLGVGDDEVVLREGYSLPSMATIFSAGVRLADDDLLPADQLRVERVERLAALEQDVVGDVDDVVDRADPGRSRR
jgi:hypothetical protein